MIIFRHGSQEQERKFILERNFRAVTIGVLGQEQFSGIPQAYCSEIVGLMQVPSMLRDPVLKTIEIDTVGYIAGQLFLDSFGGDH